MKKAWKRLLLKNTVLFFMMLAMCRASVFHAIHPFGFAFAFALASCNQNPLIIAAEYLVASLILDFSLVGIVGSLCVCIGLVLVFVIERATKKKLKSYWVGLILLLSLSGHVYLGISTPESIMALAICVLVGFVGFYIFSVAICAMIKRGKTLKFTIDEKVCHALFIMAVFSGIAELYIFNFNLTHFLCVTVLFFLSRVFSGYVTIVFACVAGIGVSLSSLSVVSISVFSLWACVMITFSSNKKIIAALMVLCSDVILGCFLNAYGTYDLLNMLPILLGCVIILCVPDKKIIELAAMLGAKTKVAEVFANSLIAKEIKQKVINVSNVFGQMENVYKTLLIGPIDKNAAVEVVASEIISKVCLNCENYKKCHSSKFDMISAFKTIAHAGVNKGKVSAIDTPTLLMTECDRTSFVLSSANAVVNGFNYLVDETKAKDCSNIQIAKQFGATASLLRDIVQKYNSEIIPDNEKSMDLYDELIYRGVDVSDVVCLNSSEGVHSVIMVVEASDIVNPDIVAGIKNILGVDFSICERKMSEISGYSIVVAKPCGHFDISCGVAVLSKDRGTDSGDNYTIAKISEGKYLYAISDGMGSGKNAHAISVATISLIENFYKAGFSSSVIIDNVNKLLIPAGEENFSCLDLVIVDAKNGRADFIKIGASISVVKSEKKSMLIECESLPLGIVERIRPSSKTLFLEHGDMVILASDGIVDSFSSHEAYLSYINHERITNPQLLADNILDEAASRRKGQKDDMSVLVIKTCQK